MPDFQRVVEYMRDVRNALPQPVTDDLRQAASEFAELCASANDRLRQCSGFLQQGLRTEAIQLAEQPPSLLDLVAALDLPDAAPWAEFCQGNDLPVPPTLQLDRAAQLNEAYAAEQPLEHLLTRHRLLALSRGPVRDRLELLRQIASQDAGSTFWEKDVRVFERARLKELPPTFHAAVKSKDFDAITALASEIENSPWLEAVPEDLRAAVSDAYQRIRRVQIEAQLADMVPALRQTFAAKSQPEATALLTQWHDAIKNAGLSGVSPELAAEVQPIVEWIRNENEAQAKQHAFATACDSFSHLLDADASNQQLEAAYARLQRDDQPIPEHLTERYHTRIAQRLAASRGKFKLRLITTAGVAFGLIIIVACLGLWLFRSTNEEQWAREIRAANAEHTEIGLARAWSLIHDQEKKSPSLNDSRVLLAAKDETKSLQAEFDRDSAALKTLAAQFTDLNNQAAALAKNNAASVDDLLAAAAAIDDALTRAANTASLAWADSNQTVSKLRSALDTQRIAARQRAAALVQTLAASLAQQADAITLATPDAAAQLAALAAKVTPYRDMPGLDQNAKAAVIGLLSKIDQRREALDLARGQVADLQAVANHATSTDDLKKALEAYVAKYPNAPLSADFSRAIAALPAAKTLETWHDLVASWAGRLPPDSAAVAAKRLEAVQAYSAANPASPLAPHIATYAEYLKQAANALADKGPWQTAMGELLANELISQLAYMEISNGARYYVIGDIKRTERRINDRVSITFEALDPKNLAKRQLVSVDPPLKLVNDQPVPLPHTKVAAGIADGLRVIDESNWDTWGFTLIDSLLKNEQMDPIVRGLLLQPALDTTVQLDGWAIGDSYEKPLRELTRQQLQDIIWFDPKNPVPIGILQALAKVVALVPPTPQTQQKYLARRAELFKMLSFDPANTGVLLKDSSGGGGGWTVSPASPPADGATAWAVAPVPATSPASAPTATLIPVATFSSKSNKFTPNDENLRDLPQGTLVFITKP